MTAIDFKFVVGDRVRVKVGDYGKQIFLIFLRRTDTRDRNYYIVREFPDRLGAYDKSFYENELVKERECKLNRKVRI